MHGHMFRCGAKLPYDRFLKAVQDVIDVNKHIAPFLFCMQVTYSRPSIALPTDSYVVCGEGPKPLDQTVPGTVAG